eukprot:354367-Chlamydomonas_euryale.AAC.3
MPACQPVQHDSVQLHPPPARIGEAVAGQLLHRRQQRADVWWRQRRQRAPRSGRRRRGGRVCGEA